MESSDKTKVAKNTIRRWLLSQNYPPEFQQFFFRWTLLNQCYNEISDELSETGRVLEFGRKNEKLINQPRSSTRAILASAIRLVQDECVGDGRGESPPNSWVKTASMQLREKMNIDIATICKRCRRNKYLECQNIQLENYKFSPFEALSRIVYQVRCNLFHGDKSEYKGEQGRRNKDLVVASNIILDNVLKEISQ